MPVLTAVKAGAKAIRPVKDEFYGDRAGTIEDPFGHKWTIATHKEDVSPEEIEKALCSGDGQGKCLGVFITSPGRRRQRGCGFRVGWGVLPCVLPAMEASGRERASRPRSQASEVPPSVLENVTAPEIPRYLQSLSNPDNVAGMARFGIQARQVYGVPLPQLKKLARQGRSPACPRTLEVRRAKHEWLPFSLMIQPR